MKLTMALFFAIFWTTVGYAGTYDYSCNICLFPSISGDGGDDAMSTESRIHFGWTTTIMSSNGEERNTP